MRIPKHITDHHAITLAMRAVGRPLTPDELAGVKIVKVEREDTTIGNELTLRGIPVVGRVGGTMRGTRPEHDGIRNLR